MNEEVKEIMRLSFHNNFFVDRNSKDANFEYLDALTDYVLTKEKSEDYEEIANKIWVHDQRIQKMFALNMEILPLCFRKDLFEDFGEDLCSSVLTIEDIKRIGRCSKSTDDFRMKFNISMMMHNWETLEVKQKNAIITRILHFLESSYAIKLENVKIYKAKKIVDDLYLSIALNELINWLSKKINVTFSYQTIDAIELLQYYEKTEMYFQIAEELSKRNIDGVNGDNQSILSSVIKPIVPDYEVDENEFVFADRTDDEISISNAYIFMYDEFCKYIHESMQEKIHCSKEIKRNYIEIQKKKEEIDILHKKVSKLQYEIDKLQKDYDVERQARLKEQKSIERELFSLREYAFNRTEKETCVIVGKEENNVYCGDYTNVVIVGGHNTWQRKVAERLQGVNILSTDQNVVDWAFMNRMEIVVVVINHISHSMYYRVIDKVREQELIYLDYKNIDQLQKEIDTILLKKGARKGE